MDILATIDEEISRLQQVRALLVSGGTATDHRGSRRGRPPGRPAKKAVKRKISAEGRKRIAAAQRARWAKLRAAKKAPKAAA